MDEKGISIIICCYNSALKIELTLQYVFALKVQTETACEVVVINNGSTDGTSEIALDFCRMSNANGLAFRVIDEMKPGLASARERGIQEAKYEVIIFCDDDNHLPSDYLIVTKEILDQFPNVGLLGGWARPKFSIINRSWLKDFYAAMAVGPQSSADGYVSSIYGAGMVAKKKVFYAIKERKIQFQLTDRIGTKLTSGGDAEICAMAEYLGFKIYYSSRLTLLHDIPENRLKKKHYLNADFNTVYPSVYLYLLKDITSRSGRDARYLFRHFCTRTIKNIFYYCPRILLGSHNFFSFFSFYRNLQILTWAVLHRKKFYLTYIEIHKNLSLEVNS